MKKKNILGEEKNKNTTREEEEVLPKQFPPTKHLKTPHFIKKQRNNQEKHNLQNLKKKNYEHNGLCYALKTQLNRIVKVFNTITDYAFYYKTNLIDYVHKFYNIID